MNAARNKAHRKAEKLRKKRQASHAAERKKLRAVTKSMVAAGDSEQAIEVLLNVVESLQKDNTRLLYRAATAIRARYGRSSEKLNAEELGQLVLALGGSEEDAAREEPDIPVPAVPVDAVGTNDTDAPKKKRRPNHHGRTKLDPNLPRDVHTVLVPDDERSCIHCSIEMEGIGYTVHEKIEFVPAQIRVSEEHREKVACKRCEQDITSAPRVESVAHERRAGASVLAQLVESKCGDALPIDRQQDQFRRLGFDVPLNTLYGYWDYATKLLTPVSDVILSTVLGDAVVGVDDTRLDFLDPADPRGKRRGHLWCFVGTGPLVAFAFTETWSAEDVEPWLAAIDGFIQCDDYKGYSSTIKAPDGTKRILVPPEMRLGCMMHVRRRFHQAFEGGHLTAAVPLKFIGDIYRVEEEARVQNLAPPERMALRQEKSLPVLERFDQWVDDNVKTLLPTSPLGSAAAYAKHQRPFVQRCFTDGRFEIDNGRVEWEIREPAIGRKNFLFAGSAAGAERLAAAYTVVLSARHAGLPVREYLVDILTKIEGGWPARRIGELLPHRWSPAAAESTTAAEKALQ